MGKSAAQLSSGTVTLAEYFPQLPYLIQSAAADHDDFQSLVTLSPDDELPALDDAGNRSMIMCPGSDTYSRQLCMRGNDRVYHGKQGGRGRLEGFAVQARVQITPYSSSMIKVKQRRGGGRRGRQSMNSPLGGEREQAAAGQAALAGGPSIMVPRVCILRWKVSNDAANCYEAVAAPEARQHSQSRRVLPPIGNNDVSQKHDEKVDGYEDDGNDRARRCSTTQRFLNDILEDDGTQDRTTSSGDGPAERTTSTQDTPGEPSSLGHINPNFSREHMESKEHSSSSPHHDDIDERLRAELTAVTTAAGTAGSVHSYDSMQVPNSTSQEDEKAAGDRSKGVHWEPEQPKRGARSVDTGGTGSTASSGLSVLRSHLDGTQRRIMEPTLKALRNTVISVLALACILAVTFARHQCHGVGLLRIRHV